MNAGVAQLVALTAHGNWVLGSQGPQEGVDLAQNSTLQYLRELSFTRSRSAVGLRLPSRIVGHTVPEWYAALRTQGVARLVLSRTLTGGSPLLKPHQAVAFAGGEQAAIVAVLPSGKTELWAPEWRVADSKAPDQRIWAVRYRASEGPPLFPEIAGPTPNTAAAILKTVLEEIGDFASRQGLGTWVPWFERAGRLLQGDASELPYHADLLPPAGYSPEARRLLNGCIGAWVFGGMGSWNDTGPDDPEELPRYEALSTELYEAVMNGLVAATNAFQAPAPVAG